MRNILILDSELLHRLRSEQCSYLSHYRPIKSLQNDGVLNLDETVEQHDINGGSETFDDLDLQDRAFKLVSFVELLRNTQLTHVAQVSHQIWKAFSSDGASRTKGDVLLYVFVLPVETSVIALLSECNNGLLSPLLELVKGVLWLHIQRVPNVVVFGTLPLVASVYLVQSDDERTLLLAEKLDGLQRLLLQTMHQVNH